jgi:hypothetical protein
LFTWQWSRICLCQMSRTSSIIWNLIWIDHCQKPSSQWYPQTHPSSDQKSTTFQLPHHSRPLHCCCLTRTSHASYVSHQHNIPYNLIQLRHDFSNFVHHQLAGMPSTVTNKLNHNLLLMPKTANEFCLNDKVLIHRDTGNLYLGKLAKPP